MQILYAWKQPRNAMFLCVIIVIKDLVRFAFHQNMALLAPCPFALVYENCFLYKLRYCICIFFCYWMLEKLARIALFVSHNWSDQKSRIYQYKLFSINKCTVWPMHKICTLCCMVPSFLHLDLESQVNYDLSKVWILIWIGCK